MSKSVPFNVKLCCKSFFAVITLEGFVSSFSFGMFSLPFVFLMNVGDMPSQIATLEKFL